MGFALSPVFAPPGQEADSESDPEERKDDGAKAGAEHRALLVQQNTKGDVFVQRVEWSRNPFLFAPAAKTSSAAVRSMAASRQASRKRRRATGSQFEDSEEDDESSDDASLGGGRLRRDAAARGNAAAGAEKHAGQNAPAPVPAPPVQMRLPCGIRCATAPLTSSPAGEGVAATSAWRGIKKYLKTTLRNNGLILTNVLSSQSDPADVDSTSCYPAGAAAFPAFVPEDSLRGFDLLRMDPSDIHATAAAAAAPNRAYKFDMGKGGVKMVGDPENFHLYMGSFRPECMEFLQKEPKSLWEIWKYAVKCNRNRAVDITDMRDFLRTEFKLIESLAPVDFVLPLQRRVADTHSRGSRTAARGPKARRNSSSSSDDSESEDDISEDDNSEDGGQSDAAHSNKTQNQGQPHPPRATFDGLYVVDCAGDAQLGYFRDQSKGYEVRMSRLQRRHGRGSGGDGDKGDVEKAQAKKSSALQVPYGALSTCMCVRRGGGPFTAADIELCGEESCLAPHYLIYRIDHSASRDAPRAAAKAPMARPGTTAAGAGKTGASTEAYYWGGAVRAAVPGATQETSGLHSPPARSTRAQFSAVKTPAAAPAPAMSQQSLSLSQLMFGSQHVPPTSQKQSQAASQSQALAEDENLGLDVTDNMMAVLNNNWNRAVGNTPFVDTALSSLLQARQ
jgi:hypothetical protein